MKTFLYLCICISISIVSLAGCGNNITAAPAQTEDSVAQARTEDFEVTYDSSQSVDISDWKPTTFDTVNNFDGVAMTVKEGTVSPTGLTLQFKSKSNSDCIYGDYFSLEKKISGAWYQVPVPIEGDYGFNSIGYSLASNGESEWAANWEWLYGSLDTGEYRIVKDILEFRGTGDYNTYYLTAGFEVKRLSY